MIAKKTTAVTNAPRRRAGARGDTPTDLDLDLPNPQAVLEDDAHLHGLVSLLSGFEAARGRFGLPQSPADLTAAVSTAADWVVRLADSVRALPPEAHPEVALATADALVLDAGKLAAKGGGWRSLFGGRPAVDQSACLLLLHELPNCLGQLLDALAGGFHHAEARARWADTAAAFVAEVRAELSWLARSTRKAVLG